MGCFQRGARKGLGVPVAQHAKCFVSWSALPSLASILSDTSLLRKALEEGVCPPCPCEAVRLKYPGWPVVSFEGCEHIASSPGCVPWPEQLQHLARWPATICLPPRYEDVVGAIRTCFRRLRDRCRVSISDACTKMPFIQTCVSQLWALHVKDLKVPITWAHAEAARAWLKSHRLFVSVFPESACEGFFVKKQPLYYIFTPSHLLIYIFTPSHLLIYIFTPSHLQI